METATSGGAVLGGYADSVDSLSPHSRGGESWDEAFGPSPAVAAAAAAAAAASASKLRLMCSYGGQIVPRPHDRTLCYLGGETRIMVVERHSTLADLQARFSRSLLGGRSFILKYQLPSEDLDSLISVTTDEDLDNMVEEYDRIAAASSSSSSSSSGGGKPSRLRLFLFPTKESTGSTSSMGSLIDDSKSETWFVDALNSAMLGRGLNSADSASPVDCLLGLDDSKPSPTGNDGGIPQDSSGKLGGGSRHGGQDNNSVPDSPMLETASSFGSASSAPSLSNLPPIRVRPDERASNRTGLEEHFAQMGISDQQKQPQQQLVEVEGFNPHMQYHPPPPPQHINISPTEKPSLSRIFSSDDDKSDHGERSSPQLPQHQQPQLPHQQQQQERPSFYDLPLPGDAPSRHVYYQERSHLASDPKQEAPISDASYRMPMQMTDKGYLLQQPPPPPPPIQAVDLLQPQQQQTQRQFVQADPHLVHHHASGTVLPMNPYYQMPIHPQQQLPQAAHPYNPQIPMYSLPVRQNPAYTMPLPQHFGDAGVAAPIPSTAKPTGPPPNTVLPPGIAPPKPELAANMYGAGIRATAPAVAQPLQPTQLIHLGDQSHQYVGYHSMNPHLPQSAAVMPVAGYGYEYADAVRAQQVFYTQATSAALPTQYQAMGAVAVMAEAPAAVKQPTDAKQTRAS